MNVFNAAETSKMTGPIILLFSVRTLWLVKRVGYEPSTATHHAVRYKVSIERSTGPQLSRFPSVDT